MIAVTLWRGAQQEIRDAREKDARVEAQSRRFRELVNEGEKFAEEMHRVTREAQDNIDSRRSP
ncbi:MAG: hypothetical protein H7Z14_06640 [Anaerolineae bacterium]|nr:hypothetical protein [Phycisphaerae bacterium]